MLAAVAVIAAGQADTATLTLAEARSKSVPALAARVLGLSGTLVREAWIVAGARPFATPDQLDSIYFAGAPERVGDAGLCRARVVIVEFLSSDRRARADRRVRAGWPERRSYWTILPQGGRGEERSACGAAGPVLPQVDVSPAFFPAYGDDGHDLTDQDAVLLPAVLRDLDEPGTIPGEAVVCRSAKITGCDRPRELLTRLDTIRPQQVTLAPCEYGQQFACIKARYEPASTGETSGSYTEIRITAERRERVVRQGMIRWTETSLHIRSVVIDRINWIA